MILSIKYKVDWELIRQQKQTQINKDNIYENRNRVYHDYNAVDKVMITDHVTYKYETSYKGTFAITWCFTNGTVNLQYGPIKIKHNIRRIKPYKYDTKVEDIEPKNMYDDINILSPVIYLCIILKLGHQVYNQDTH